MDAYVISDDWGSLVKKVVPLPVINSRQVLVEIHFCGLCHTDVHMCCGDFHKEAARPSHDMILGHEGVGKVIAIGSLVDNVRLGDRVGLPWQGRSCGRCDECVSGHENTCGSMEMRSFTSQGCMAPLASADADFVVPIPEALSSMEAAPILCAGVTSYRAIKESGVRAGQWLCIWGASGGLGHLAIQYAKALGILVIAVETTTDKVSYCLSHGADGVILSTHSNLTEEIKKATADEGPHGALVLAPSRAAFEGAVRSSRRGGHVVLVALPRDDFFEICISEIIMRRITVSGSFVGTRQDLAEALDFAARGLIHCDLEVRNINCIHDCLKMLRSFEFKGRLVLDLQKE